MKSPFENFDWKNGTITQKHIDYMRLWVENEIEILLGTQPTNEKLAKQHLAEVCKTANIKYDKVIFVDSPKQLLDSVRNSVRDSVCASVSERVGNRVWDRIRDIVGDSVRVSLDNCIGDRIRDIVGENVGDSVGSSIRDSLEDSASAWDRIRDIVGDSVRDSVWDSVGAWYTVGWQAYQFYSQEFQKNKIEPYCKLMEQVVGLLKIDNDIYLVRKPIRLVRNQEGRLHYDHGKAIEWADGYGFYYLMGVEFDYDTWKKIVDQEFTMKDLASGKLNAQQRPVAIAMLRPDRLLRQVKAKLIDTGIKGTKLYQADSFMDTGETEYCMLMSHPTLKDKQYIEWVDPEIGRQKDADLAQATAFGIPKEDYLLAVEA